MAGSENKEHVRMLTNDRLNFNLNLFKKYRQELFRHHLKYRAHRLLGLARCTSRSSNSSSPVFFGFLVWLDFAGVFELGAALGASLAFFSVGDSLALGLLLRVFVVGGANNGFWAAAVLCASATLDMRVRAAQESMILSERDAWLNIRTYPFIELIAAKYLSFDLLFSCWPALRKA
jgi:hypothetical protein